MAEREAAAPAKAAATQRPFDVFLSYKGSDKRAVERIARSLRAAGLELWLDAWSLTPGGRWQEELADGLRASGACAVFIGPSDLGDWEREELAVAQNLAATDRGYRVFPVLLPGLPDPFDPGSLPPFLATRTWVDLRSGIDDARSLDLFVKAVRGLPAGDSAPDLGLPGESPYRGLEAFEEEHADVFFGRDGDVQRLLEKLKESRFLAVLGPSGSGKSSLIRAGLVPALHRGRLPGSERWSIERLTPGWRPLDALASALLRLRPIESMQRTVAGLADDARTLDLATVLALGDRPRDERAVWIVDQAEELYTLCREERERIAFLDNLLYAAAVPGGRCAVVLAMRADFYPKAAAYPELAQQLSAHQFLVGPLTDEGLRAAIEEPAWRAGLELEPGLVEAIRDDVGREPGALPLLEYALLEVWKRRAGRTLTLGAYRAAGGVDGAVAGRAEQIFASFTPDQKEVARRLFVRLTQPGEGTEDTRRRAARDELETGATSPEEIAGVVGSLADARLLTTGAGERGEEVVDVAHEALIRGWPRLRGWLDEDREGLRLHRRITEAAQEWARLLEDDGALLRGAPLAAAREWRREHDGELSKLERRFLGASERRASRARRRARLAVGALGVAALGFAALAAAALVERSRADDERTRAAARELAASALAQLERDPELAVRLAAEAARRSDEPDVVSVLRRTLSTSASRGTTQVSTASVNDVAFSPNGQVVAAAAGDGVRLWRVGAAAPQRRIGGKRPVPLTVAFGEDGKRLLVLYADGIRVWDLEHGGPPRLLTLSAQAAAFAPDGRLVATSAGGKTVDLWDIAARRRVARIPIPRTAGSDVSLDVLAFSADGKRLAVAWEEDRVRVAVIDVRARRVDAGPFRLAESASSLALNADGSRLAVGGEKARVLNTTVGTVEATTDAVPEGVADVDFSADGNLLVAAANDGTGRVFASGTGELLRELRGHRSVVRKGAGAIEENGATATAVDPTGRLVATAGLDGTVRFWSAGSAGDSEQVTGSGGQIPFAVDQRHAQVAAFGSGGRLSVWRVTGHRLVERRQVRLPSVRAIALSPDGLTVATASDTGTLRAYPIEGGRSAAEHVFRDHWFSRLAFSPDGNTFAGAGDHLDLVAARTLAPIRPSRRATPSNFWEVVWSPDGALVATGGSDRRIRIWDARRSIRPRVLRGHRGDVTALAFSPDGAVLASGSADATVRIWDAGTFAPRAIVSGHSVNVLDVNFSPDAEFFVTAGGDGKVRIWETRTLESVMVVGGAEAARAASFVSSDVIASAVWESGGAQALLRLTACDVCVPRRRLLELVDERRTRALAVEERRRYLHE